MYTFCWRSKLLFCMTTKNIDLKLRGGSKKPTLFRLDRLFIVEWNVNTIIIQYICMRADFSRIYVYLYWLSCYVMKHNASTTTLRFLIILQKFLRTLADSRRSTDCDRALKCFMSNMLSNPDATKSDARFSFYMNQSFMLFWPIMSFVLRLSRRGIIIIIMILRRKIVSH